MNVFEVVLRAMCVALVAGVYWLGYRAGRRREQKEADLSKGWHR